MQGTTGMQGPKIATAKAQKVLKKVNEDDMDSKIKHFGKTAVCISVDDCIEECKSFTAFDPNVETTVCETPYLFTCNDDNLCDVQVPTSSMPKFRAIKVRVGKGGKPNWLDNNVGMMTVNGVEDLWS